MQREIGPLKALKKIVMIEPDDSHVYEGERIREIRGPFVQEIFPQSPLRRVGTMYFDDQKGDDDRECPITEHFQSRRIGKLWLIVPFRRANRNF
jgi:hypothetical protein